MSIIPKIIRFLGSKDPYTLNHLVKYSTIGSKSQLNLRISQISNKNGSIPANSCSFIISKRYLSNNSSNNETKKVNIGEGTWEEVYKGVLTTQVRLVKTFSLSTSIMGVCMQPLLAQELSGTGIPVMMAVGSFVGFFTFVTPFLIHKISKNYVTKLEYDGKEDVYSATTLSFFLKEKKIKFKVEDVAVPDVPGMFTTFKVQNRSLFVDFSQFENLDHYRRIMGYDKPIDLHLNLDNSQDEKKN